MHLHIDGDIIKYRAAFAAEKMHYYVDMFDEDNYTTHHFDYKKEMNEFLEKGEAVGILLDGTYQTRSERIAEPVENALHNVKNMLATIKTDLASDDITVYLSGKTNFRKGVGDLIYKDHPCPGYKANRKDDHKPVHGDAIVDYISQYYPVDISVDEEADDAMGIAQYKMWLSDPNSTCIVTLDKDLDMIPGQHYNFVKEEQYEIDIVTADTVFWRQLLTGDRTDNIPGLKGVGPKTAEKAIEWNTEDKDCYDLVLERYIEQYGVDDAPQALLENARMIWIRRETNEFWSPPA